ncbi:MAG: hypothetical protein CMH22_05780 [Methylophaga sp.]|nr:hypothetical protein [Methylophaga sp.]|tara:strand:+ start:87710 stop:87940 length:231 start_codon:yes stop_codon:yes gene_type:complete
MENIDYRKEGLTRLVKTELVPWLKDQGLIKPDFETIGEILKDTYKGENDKFEKLSNEATELLKEATEFLNLLKTSK